jgi:YVTN family beta-propeller protein
MRTALRAFFALALMSVSAAYANNVQGSWSPVGNWPLISAHAVLTIDGRVLTYGTDGSGNQTAFFIYDVWDPSAGLGGGHVTLPNVTNTDIFCGSQVVLPDSGKIFLAGGDNFVNGATNNIGNNNSNVFNPLDSTISRGNNMNRIRWYSTSTVMPNGEVYIQAGEGGEDRPEIRGLNGAFRLLSGADTSNGGGVYPRNWVAPDGRVFSINPDTGLMSYINTAGNGSIVTAGQLAGTMHWSSSAVMYRPGRIIHMGGKATAARVIDINGGTPVVTATASMSSVRSWVTATVLADGRVLGTGGSAVDNELTGVNNIAEIWNPVTGTWTQGAAGALARMYHSTALLLPDARVLISGGGAPGPLVNLNAEIYTPPYLYNASGQLAGRPTIETWPSNIDIATTFDVGVGNAASVSRVTLVKTGSVTHSWNMDQRFIELPFTAAGAMLSVQSPARATDAPPGYYLLFVLDGSGVPSVAKIVKVNISGSTTPASDFTQIIGGGGGAESSSYQLSCFANEVMVGAYGTAGTQVNQIGPQCVNVDVAGHWIGAPVNRGLTGTTPATAYTRTCPTNFAVSGFRGRASEGVDQLEVECKALTSAGKVTGVAQYLASVGGTGGTAQGPYNCGTNNPAYSLTGRSSTTVRSFGMQCRQGVATPVNVPPTVTSPGSQTTNVGTPVDLLISASDADGNPLTFGASGLPAGLSINAGTGRITGTPNTVGNSTVTVTVSDGTVTTPVTFSWVVSQPAQFTLNPLALTAPAAINTVVGYAANFSNGTQPQFKWQFDDGTPETAFSPSPTVTHTFSAPGVYYVTVTAADNTGPVQSETVAQIVHFPIAPATKPNNSSNIAYEKRTTGNDRLWVVNQDNDTVSVFDAVLYTKLKEISVGTDPRSVAIAPNGNVWITNKTSATISIIDASALEVASTVALPFGSQPYGLAFSVASQSAYVVLEGSGKVLKMSGTNSPTVQASISVGANARHVGTNELGSKIYVTRFVTPPVTGESTSLVQYAGQGGVVQVLDSDLNLLETTRLAASTGADTETSSAGLPNYLGAPVVSPDGRSAWVPSKKDNLQRGTLRNGLNLNFQNTVRAIGSRLLVTTGVEPTTEDLAGRLDFDNSSLASAMAFDKYGAYLFAALETSREVAVVDAAAKLELFRINVGRAPQGLTVSADGMKLFVHNFMDRTVGVYDISRLIQRGEFTVTPITTLSAVAAEKLTSTVLKGKQFFYDARDTRLARDSYMSCASCHNDGGNDGRVWDLTGMGEGLRNTISLRGRAGMAQGFLHWSGNFDEVQDFEKQIRDLAGGTGLMSDAQFNTGTRSQPLGDAKTGVSTDLDALAAYLGSLTTFANSPNRNTDGTLTTAAVAGKAVFKSANCAQCHSGTAFTESGAATFRNIGTLKPSSGSRLGGTLTGIDTPTLRDAWFTPPYLHDGSSATIADAVRAHNNVTLTEQDIQSVAAYVAQIGGQEVSAVTPLSITARVPASGATGVGSLSTVTVTFSEALDPSSVATNSFELRNSTNTVVPATVAYNAATLTVTLTPSSPLAFSSQYNVTVRGGATDPRVKDASGASMPASSTWSFTTGVNDCPCTIWPSNTVPAVNGDDPAAVVVGVKFRSDVAGYVWGIRFYKGPQNTGTHIGTLWSAAGASLATATFSSESASGWQQVNFATPVAIAANTTYIASYFAPKGFYSHNDSYFAAAGTDRLMLHAPATGAVSGGNGVYRYSATNAVPNSTFQGANYWVDVVFNTVNTTTPDTAAPALSITGPTSTGTFATSTTPLTVSGTASDNIAVTQVSWVNSRGGSGNATGTTSWSAAGIALLSGDNVITVTARDAAGNTTSQALTVTYTPPPDTTAPAVTITAPTTAATFTTTTTPITVSGTSSDAVGVTSVTWANDRGGSGTATGTTSWSVTGIVLQSGVNNILISAKDAANNTGTRNLAVTYNPVVPDTTPPTATPQTPAIGAAGVSLGTTVTVLFSEAINTSTLTTSSFELRNAANTLVAAAVTYNATTRVGTLTPTAVLTPSTVYTVTVRGGGTDPRVKDVAGNALPANVTWSFTTGADPCPCTLFPATATPGADGDDPDAVTVGVKVRSDVAGFITAIRFYKGPTNTGTHIASLWTTAGTSLASATFTSETASGWQQVNFATPVQISANTNYVASVFMPLGRYSFNDNYFTTAVTRVPLRAQTTSAAGGNGVYRYNATNIFPNQTFAAANYWVDVVFVQVVQ